MWLYPHQDLYKNGLNWEYNTMTNWMRSLDKDSYPGLKSAPPSGSKASIGYSPYEGHLTSELFP